jgi:septum formation protein
VRIVLASTSPRRREILALLGLPFDVIDPDFEEISSDETSAEEEVVAFSSGKAEAVPRDPASIVIGSDTLIALGGEKIGKPRDQDDALRMLSMLSGRCHEILTGLVVIGPDEDQIFSHVERVHVEMVPFSHEGIVEYLEVGESLDKAGGYSIQGRGSQLIAAIRGDYLAAVGLPLRAIARYLKELGLNPPVDVEQLYRQRQFCNWQSIRVRE